MKYLIKFNESKKTMDKYKKSLEKLNSISEKIETKFDDIKIPETEEYDSTEDTTNHIKDVATLLINMASELLERASKHDDSKLKSPEKELFDKYTLKDLEYGSKEYKKSLDNLKPALDHHYANNSHHPEYYKNGIKGMDIIDIIEMLCDWSAAVKRNKNGDILKSIDINHDRFKLSEELKEIFINSAKKYNL